MQCRQAPAAQQKLQVGRSAAAPGQHQGRRQWTVPVICQVDRNGAAQQCSAEPQQRSQQEQQQPLPQALQQLSRVAVGVAAAAVLALTSATPPAAAVLASPRANIARSADVALRRSIPAFNQDVEKVQDKLEVSVRVAVGSGPKTVCVVADCLQHQHV
jgi:hypothetical protein